MPIKRSFLSVAALGAVLLSAGISPVFAESGTTPAPAKADKLVQVATLRGAQAIREFEANVRLVQAQRNEAVQLAAAVEMESNAKKKAGLKAQLDKLLQKLNENNAQMIKAYGFSLARNYQIVPEAIGIYAYVTDAEAARIEQARKAAAKTGQR